MSLHRSPHTHSTFWGHCFYVLWNGWSGSSHRIESFLSLLQSKAPAVWLLPVDLHLSKLNNMELISPYTVPRFPKAHLVSKTQFNKNISHTTSWRFPVRQCFPVVLCFSPNFFVDLQRTHTPLSRIRKFCFYRNLSFLISSQTLKVTFNPLVSFESPIPGFIPSLHWSKIMV